MSCYLENIKRYMLLVNFSGLLSLYSFKMSIALSLYRNFSHNNQIVLR